MQFQDRLLDYLRDKDVPFTMRHLEDSGLAVASPFDSWQEGPLVKVVLAFINRKLAMLVMRDDQQVDLERLRDALPGHGGVTLVDPDTLDDAFPEVELSAIPPLGELWQLPVFIDVQLSAVPSIRFLAGSHIDIVTLRRDDFCRLSKPMTLSFAVPKGAAIPLRARQKDVVHAL